MGSGRGQRRRHELQREGRIAVSDDPLRGPARRRRPRARCVPSRRLDADAPISRQRRRRLRHRRHRRGRRHACLQAGRGRLFRRRAGCRAVFPAAGGFRLRRDRADKALLDRRPHLDGDNPLQMGSNNSGKAVGGSTVHFAMVSLRFRPEWFKSRSLLGYGADWPLDWREMWDYYAEVEAGAEDLRAGQLPLGSAAAALSLSGARTQCRRARAGERLRGVGRQLDGDAAGHVVGAARAGASVRLSRLLRHRLFDQRQAERARHLDSPRARAPARKSATSPWSAGSRSTPPARRPACIITAKAAGGFNRRATSSSPATRSRRRGCC